MHVSMYVCTGVRSGAGKAYGRVTLRRVRLAEENFARGDALPLLKVRRGERLELAFPLTGLGARQCARAAMRSEDRRGEGTLARVGVPQQSWVDPALFEAAAAIRSLLTPAKCESERAPTRKNGQSGWTTGRSGAAHLAWSAHRESARRAWLPAPLAPAERRKRTTCAPPFRLGEVYSL
jgi:hypothetical protein